MSTDFDPAYLQLVARWLGDPEPLWKDGRSGNGPDLVCDSATNVLKFLLYFGGAEWRQRQGMDRILVPYSRQLVRPGFSITSTPEGVRGEVALTSDGTEHSASRTQDGHAIEFTYYGAASLAEIRESMESADGSPLFADVRKVPASSLEYARP